MRSKRLTAFAAICCMMLFSAPTGGYTRIPVSAGEVPAVYNLPAHPDALPTPEPAIAHGGDEDPEAGEIEGTPHKDDPAEEGGEVQQGEGGSAPALMLPFTAGPDTIERAGHAVGDVIINKSDLSTATRISDGDVVYTVTDGVYLKRAESDYFQYPNAWEYILLTPDEVVFGLLFEPETCPERHPYVCADSAFATVEPLGDAPVAYGNLLGWEYRVDDGYLPGVNILEVSMHHAGRTDEYPIRLEHIYMTDLADLGEFAPRSLTSVYAPADGEHDSETFKVDNGVYFSDSGNQIDIEYYGAGRYVIWIDQFKVFETMPVLNLVFDASEYGRYVKVVYTKENRTSAISQLFKLDRPMYESETDYRAEPDEPQYYSGGMDQRFDDTMITAHIMGENGAQRVIHYIINPVGDFTFPVAGIYEEDLDAESQSLIAKLISAIQKAEPNSTVTFDASRLPYLPYYIADELVRVSEKNITLELTYVDESRVTSAISSLAVQPPGPGRIYYPLNEVGMNALAPL